MTKSGSKRILVVEDEVVVARNICISLERMGYVPVGPVSDANLAVQTAIAEKPDVILMDIKLDGNTSGIDAARELNAELDVPVIFITAHSDPKTVERAIQTTPYGYLHKPFNKDEVRSTIEMALEKHEAKLEIARRENIFSTTLKSIGDGVITSDASLLVTYANPAAEKLLGKPQSGLTGVALSEVCHFFREDGGEKIPCPSENVIQTGNRWHLPDDALLLNDRDEYIPVSGTFSVILNDRNKPSGIVVVLKDTTRLRNEARSAKIRLRLEAIENDVRMRLIRDAHPDMVSILGMLGKAVSADRAYVSLFPTDDLHEETDIEITEWLDENRDLSRQSDSGESGMYGKWLLGKIAEGTPVSIPDTEQIPPAGQKEEKNLLEAGVKSLVVFPFHSWDTEYFGYIAIEWISQKKECTEIEWGMLSRMSEQISSFIVRSKAEALIRRSENRFRTLIHKSSDIITVLNPDRKVVFISPSVKRILGYEVEELMGTDGLRFIHEEDITRVEEAFSSTMNRIQEEHIVEHRYLHKDGNWVYLESVGSNMIRDREVGGVVINSRDITDRKRVEQELIRARDTAEEMNRVKTALLANMSHEMRTPLTGILGFAGILESDLPDGEAREMAMRIHISGRRLLETIESILDLAKLEAEKIDVQFEQVNLVKEIDRAMEVHARTAQHKNLKFYVESDIEELLITLDRQLFNRIMYNLLSNALKYTEKGEITVSIAKFKKGKKNWAQVDVRDTGVGISAEFLPKVFDEFQQESFGLSRKYEGSGLGLTISRKLVEVMDGEISVNSKKGEGTIFTIRLPVSEGEEQDEGLGQGTIRKTVKQSEKPRILLVEDDYDSSVIARFFLGNDFQVDPVESGEKSLVRLRNREYAMVIMDISLGSGMDGVSTLKAIRKNSQLTDLPVVALTAHALSGDAEFYLSQGFSAYLAKPFKKDELIQVVMKILKEQNSDD